MLDGRVFCLKRSIKTGELRIGQQRYIDGVRQPHESVSKSYSLECFVSVGGCEVWRFSHPFNTIVDDACTWPAFSLTPEGLERARATTAAPEPLTGKAANVYEILKALAPHRALTAPGICDEYQRKHNEILDESSLRKHLLPQLERYGLKHKPRVGYSL